MGSRTPCQALSGWAKRKRHNWAASPPAIRRKALFWLLAVLLVVSLQNVREADGGEGSAALAALAGENLDYDISFLWFDGLARGRLRFERGDGERTYRAVLEAETLGLAAWLSSHQVRRFESLMELGPSGRLRPLIHESLILRGWGEKRREEGSRYLFDHERGAILYRQTRDGVVHGEKSLDAGREGEMPGDILSAFYNLRLGLLGPVRPGNPLVLPVCASGEISRLVVESLPRGSGPDGDFFPEGGRLSRVSLDREIFGTAGGWVYVWFDGEGRPARGMIEDVIGLGDVRGSIRD